MKFDYMEYYNKLVLFPLIFVIIGFLMIMVSIIIYFQYPRFQKWFKFSFDRRILLVQVIAASIIMSIGFATMNIKLVFEKESNAVELTGTITDLSSVPNAPRLIYQNDLVHAKFIEVDTAEFYIMYIGDFRVGDEVTIQYLPNSRIVLEININEDQ